MAFLARSMSFAVGQRGDTNGPVSRNDAFQLGGYVGTNHSGEWELPLQKVYKVYNQLLKVTDNKLIED